MFWLKSIRIAVLSSVVAAGAVAASSDLFSAVWSRSPGPEARAGAADHRGACCFDNGFCAVITEAECADLGGIYQGTGTFCTPDTCPKPGACCLPDGTCVEPLSERQCRDRGGDPQEPGSRCRDIECAGGGEGCTPGYWKQSQHFDSWPPPYDPETPFADVFEDAFPGLTLLDVLEQGGGGLKALGRHTVAALLNAASGDVSYDLTEDTVVGLFDDEYPDGDYEGLKDMLELFNESGCPLD